MRAIDAEAVEDVDDALRALVERECRGERSRFRRVRAGRRGPPGGARRSARPAPTTCRRSSAGSARTGSRPRRRDAHPIRPSAVSTVARPSVAPRRSTLAARSVAVERRLLQVQPVQHRRSTSSLIAPGVALVDERLAFGREHLESQPPERRRRALADLVVAAAQPLPRGVLRRSFQPPQDLGGVLARRRSPAAGRPAPRRAGRAAAWPPWSAPRPARARRGASSSPCTSSTLMSHGSVSPCSSSVPITTTNVRNTSCGRPGNAVTRQRRHRHRERGGQRHHAAHARPRHDEHLRLGGRSARGRGCAGTAGAAGRRTRTPTRSARRSPSPAPRPTRPRARAAEMPVSSPTTVGSCSPISRNANDSRTNCTGPPHRGVLQPGGVARAATTAGRGSARRRRPRSRRSRAPPRR